MGVPAKGRRDCRNGRFRERYVVKIDTTNGRDREIRDVTKASRPSFRDP